MFRFCSCWMSLSAFYYAFAIPTGLIILANLTIFIITIFSIFSRPKGLRCNQSKQKIAVTNLQMAVTSFILLGKFVTLQQNQTPLIQGDGPCTLPFQLFYAFISSLRQSQSIVCICEWCMSVYSTDSK